MGKASIFGRIRLRICPLLSLKLCTVGFALLLVQVAAGQDSDSSEKAGSIWDALGDLAEEVERMESGEPPDDEPIRMVTVGGSYPPGRFTGICRHYAHPPPYKNGDHWITRAVDSHFYKLEDDGWNGVGSVSRPHYRGQYQECTSDDYLWLGDPADPVRGPGKYKVVLEGYEEEIVYGNNMTHTVWRKEYNKEILFQVVEVAGDCANADVIISSPYDRFQVSFDDSPDGVLEFEAQATVSPADCADEIIWSANAIGSSEATITPPTGEKVTLRYTGLSEYNSDFGPLEISARVLGAGETREVLVFFDGKARNHPGEGSGEIPNWFHYWGQTSALGDFSEPRYVAKMPACSGTDATAQARYVYKDDVIYMVDLVYKGECVARQGPVIDSGSIARGIDCYAELIRHEGVHQVELKKWWAPFKGEAEPAMCGPSSAWILNKIAGIDSDGDFVPDIVEKPLAATRGCDAENERSCSGRPGTNNASGNNGDTDSTPIDVEMNAYTIAWNAWKLGSADAEDWSKCGAQWTNKTGCVYK